MIKATDELGKEADRLILSTKRLIDCMQTFGTGPYGVMEWLVRLYHEVIEIQDNWVGAVASKEFLAKYTTKAMSEKGGETNIEIQALYPSGKWDCAFSFQDSEDGLKRAFDELKEEKEMWPGRKFRVVRTYMSVVNEFDEPRYDGGM